MDWVKSESLRVGGFEIWWLAGGVFELDGGAMFGVVPKVLWSRKYTSQDNYIRLLASPLLIRTPEALVVVETGLGNKLSDKQKKIFRVVQDWALPESLASLGYGPEDVSHVVLTHCDFDHAGGVVMHDPEGRSVLTFPNARHVVQKVEWEDATRPNRRSAHTYWPQNFEGLEPGRNLFLVEGEHEVCPGVRVSQTGGHTRGHQVVHVQSEGQSAVHMADLLPTHVHFNPLWLMAYDNFPLEAMEAKERIEREGIQSGSWFTFYHDPYLRACRYNDDGEVVERFPS